MPAKEYTVGIPIATVLFLALIAAALYTVATSSPSKAELRDESALVIRELRMRADEFIPPNNDDPTGPTLFAESDRYLTNLRVYGLTAPDQQRRVVDTLEQIRQDLRTRPIVVHFHYPKRVDNPEDSPSATPSAEQRPEPFKTVRINAPLPDTPGAER
jgi:hypothetical protein